MNTRTERPDTRPATGASDREQALKASVASLFRHCSAHENPPLAFSRASSKIGYLARDGVRTELHYLEAALNEHKHVLLQRRIGNTVQASEHAKERDQHLRSFGTAVQRSLVYPKDPPSTPELRAQRPVDPPLVRRTPEASRHELQQAARPVRIVGGKDRGLDR